MREPGWRTHLMPPSRLNAENARPFAARLFQRCIEKPRNGSLFHFAGLIVDRRSPWIGDHDLREVFFEVFSYDVSLLWAAFSVKIDDYEIHSATIFLI